MHVSYLRLARCNTPRVGDTFTTWGGKSYRVDQVRHVRGEFREQTCLRCWHYTHNDYAQWPTTKAVALAQVINALQGQLF